MDRISAGETNRWGGNDVPGVLTYGHALRHFVRNFDEKTLDRIRELRDEQAQLERRWKAGRDSLQLARATRAKLEDYDARVYAQAEKYAARLVQKLGGLNLLLFESHARSETLEADRARFMLFLSDLLS